MLSFPHRQYLSLSQYICQNWETDIGILLLTKFQTAFWFHRFFHQNPLSIPASNPKYHVEFNCHISPYSLIGDNILGSFSCPWGCWGVLVRYPIEYLFFFWGGGLFRAAPLAYGSSQARGRMGAVSFQPTSPPQQRQIWAAPEACTTAHGNSRSSTQWARPGTKPASLWILVGFVTEEPLWELQIPGFVCCFSHNYIGVWGLGKEQHPSEVLFSSHPSKRWVIPTPCYASSLV